MAMHMAMKFLNLPNNHETNKDKNTIEKTAKIQVQRAFEIMNVCGDWNDKEIEKDHHELKISDAINDKNEFSKVEKFKILDENEKVDKTTNLEPDCQVRVEHIEKSTGKLNFLSHEEVINWVHPVYHQNHENYHTQKDNVSHHLDSLSKSKVGEQLHWRETLHDS